MATILHPPLQSAASLPTWRQDGEVKNTLISEASSAFVPSTRCHGDGDGDCNSNDDSDDDAQISGIYAPATAKLKWFLNKLENLIKTMRKITISSIEISEI